MNLEIQGVFSVKTYLTFIWSFHIYILYIMYMYRIYTLPFVPGRLSHHTHTHLHTFSERTHGKIYRSWVVVKRSHYIEDYVGNLFVSKDFKGEVMRFHRFCSLPTWRFRNIWLRFQAKGRLWGKFMFSIHSIVKDEWNHGTKTHFDHFEWTK